MEHFSRRRWTTIPAPSVSYSVHEVNFFCFSCECTISYVDLLQGLYGCSSPATKVLHDKAKNGKAKLSQCDHMSRLVSHTVAIYNSKHLQKYVNCFAKWLVSPQKVAK